MTTFRSGFTLWQMVSGARELTEHPSVLERIDAVLRIMGPAFGRTGYGKGRPLVNALEDVAQESLLLGDFALAQRFQRFAAYAGGELFLEILENYYDEKARHRSEESMRRLVALGADRAVAVLDALSKDNPEATMADARDLLRGIALSVDHLGLGMGEGGIRLMHIWTGQSDVRRVALSCTSRLRRWGCSPA
ncbi:hypothetical protein ABZY44_08735 [Streptomyces sp. NPDC006544]|uniref:hypothetical protein n=1 Tax=Streptomyces sp. NPDC006544 TaxID=3154583 RepID=UPI0033B0380B